MKKVALVTGASRGIGRAIARRLAADGYAVAVHYHSHPEEAQVLCEEISRDGGQAACFFADVAVEEQVTAMLEAVTARLGEITLLVNNAGIAGQKLFTDLTTEEWHRMMAVHVDGAFYTCRGVLPGMIRRHSGCIINLSSMWGQTGGSCEVHYSVAKAALIGLTKALAKEVGPSGIRVNCVAPGVIRTAMLDELDEDTLQELAEETPLCRLGTPEDVARAVAFLASEQADFITGQILAPNGGYVI